MTILDLVFEETALEVPAEESTVLEVDQVLVIGSNVAGGDVTQQELDDETTAREAADTSLQAAIDAEVIARGTAVTTEATARATADGLLIPLSQRAAANGVATLGADGKVPDNQLPALAITDTFPVASQAAMLALTAEVGDVAIRSDLNKSFILRASPASTLSNWSELLTPTDAVLSVDGQVGAVSLATDAAANTGSKRTLGTGALQATAGNDSRLSDARTPTAHAASHASGGGDAITIAESQVTNLPTDLAAKAQRLTPTAVKTANYTAVAGDLVPIDTSSANVVVTLPNAPADGSVVGIKYVTQGFFTASYACAGSDVLDKTGGSTTGTLDWLLQGVLLQYKASGAIWYRINDDLPYSVQATIFANRAVTKGWWYVGDGSAMSPQLPGNDGLVVSADSTQTTGLKYRSIGFLRKTGVTEYFAPENGAPTTTMTLTNQRVYFLPFSVNQNYTVDRLACSVTTAQATTVARLGIFTSANGRPSTLLVEPASTADVSTTGDKELTLSQALTPGLYWLAICVQGTSGVVMRATSPNYNSTTGSTTLSDHTAAATTVVWVQSSVSGAFSTISTASPVPFATASVPRVIVRVT